MNFRLAEDRGTGVKEITTPTPASSQRPRTQAHPHATDPDTSLIKVESMFKSISNKNYVLSAFHPSGALPKGKLRKAA
ncbi:hypothetical protein TNCV_4844411 [Trichonephila clavipes]|uniref:Uncharacterized protein n=1 Tax=Trichonephila clavipes TaxID=2585209 RepID=A0A8X6WJC6_TRICX|nr:hypothetical protein TNCV_4844411 [Trichonephila clavipes]